VAISASVTLAAVRLARWARPPEPGERTACPPAARRRTYPEGGLPACLDKLPGRSAKSIYGHANTREAARDTPRQH
jgi:hypothetical protein